MAFSFATPTATPATGGFSFGGASATPAASSTGMLSFGGGTTTPAASTGGFSFGGTPAAAATTTPAAGGFSFGGGVGSLGQTTPASSGGFSFGGSTTTPAASTFTTAAGAPAASSFAFGGAAAAPKTAAATQQIQFNAPFESLPPQFKEELSRVQGFIHKEKRIRDELSSHSNEDAVQTYKAMDVLLDKLKTLVHTLENDRKIVNQFKGEVRGELKNAEFAVRNVERLRNPALTTPQRFYLPSEYFIDLAVAFEAKMQQYKLHIETIEQYLQSTSNPKSHYTPQMLKDILRNQYSSFMSLASGVAVLHGRAQELMEHFLHYEKTYFNHTDATKLFVAKDTPTLISSSSSSSFSSASSAISMRNNKQIFIPPPTPKQIATSATPQTQTAAIPGGFPTTPAAAAAPASSSFSFASPSAATSLFATPKAATATTNTSLFGSPRSEERRVGKECRSRWSPYH
eukprot:TRINITY_DN351_c0_g1_i2.p1 TRINITY_DN351_c0_g1~~TRINITY_DN351_c0_g1_i2.p1  ORF type:complete len:458 (-),score=112.24 TRINITY_DN351_c0_g1_i2:67-1440(-)